MSFETVLTGMQDNIGIVTLNRPEHFNTFSSRLAVELNEALTEMEADPDVRVVIVTGAGKVFSTGIDISEYPVITSYSIHYTKLYETAFGQNHDGAA